MVLYGKTSFSTINTIKIPAKRLECTYTNKYNVCLEKGSETSAVCVQRDRFTIFFQYSYKTLFWTYTLLKLLCIKLS